MLECPVPVETSDAITLAHGGGGRLTHRLLADLVLPALTNPLLDPLHDGAVFAPPGDRFAFTTDTYVIHPYEFPGGDIGKLSVCGTVNDLAMCGARPTYLSLALILEEGFPTDALKRIVASVRSTCAELGVSVVTGDTKVVERGKGDGIFINTSGLGVIGPGVDVAPRRARPRDRVLLSGAIAEHGVAVLSVREGLGFETQVPSDVAGLWPLVSAMLDAGGEGIHVLRDATRGGVASVLHELARAAGAGIVLDEASVPVREEVRGACEILGLDPLTVANEGKCVVLVAPERAEAVLAAMRLHPLGRDACDVGQVVAEHRGVVRVKTRFGPSRVLDPLSGEPLPRIC